MKKTLQRLSKLVMAVLLFGMCVLFSGCFLDKISPYTRARFHDFVDTWVCDAEDFKMSLETKGERETRLYSTLTLNGEEIDVFIHIGTGGSRGMVWIYDVNNMEFCECGADPLQESAIFTVIATERFLFRSTITEVTWEIKEEKAEYVGENSLVGKEFLFTRQVD